MFGIAVIVGGIIVCSTISVALAAATFVLSRQSTDDDAFRVTFRELHRELTVDAGEATGKGIACGGNDCSAGHQVMSATVRLHASVTGALGAGIDPENPHAREASISFSSMSKLAQTC